MQHASGLTNRPVAYDWQASFASSTPADGSTLHHSLASDGQYLAKKFDILMELKIAIASGCEARASEFAVQRVFPLVQAWQRRFGPLESSDLAAAVNSALRSHRLP